MGSHIDRYDSLSSEVSYLLLEESRARQQTMLPGHANASQLAGLNGDLEGDPRPMDLVDECIAPDMTKACVRWNQGSPGRDTDW